MKTISITVWEHIAVHLPIVSLSRCLTVNRHVYSVASRYLYGNPPFDARYGSPLPRFLAFLNALPKLSSQTRILVRIIDLTHIETTLCDELPETWLYTLANYCPSLTALYTSELTSFLNYSAIAYLRPGMLSSVRRLRLESPVDLSETALCRLLEATSKLEELQITDCSAVGIACMTTIGQCIASTLTHLSFNKCLKITDRVLARLFQQNGNIMVMFPSLNTLQLCNLPLTTEALQMLAINDSYLSFPQLTRLSLRESAQIGTAGILAFIGQRRNTVIATAAQPQLQAKELDELDLRGLPLISPILLSHLTLEAPQLRRLSIDIDLLRTRNDRLDQRYNHVCDPYSWSLTQLQLFRQLEHLIVDTTNTTNGLYNERASAWWYICNSLQHLKTLSFIGRWLPPSHEVYETESDWGWTVPLDTAKRSNRPTSLSVTSDGPLVYLTDFKNPLCTINPTVASQFSLCRQSNPSKISVRVAYPRQTQHE
ncbi:hypothetical protein BDF19DRAFT_414696 [Syncephalis fuscata]|nr:hypothetical protein BDF19DRAFT_414696 [Syncephalis fuscata]